MGKQIMGFRYPNLLPTQVVDEYNKKTNIQIFKLVFSRGVKAPYNIPQKKIR
jgi:hypothetical protein